MNLPVIHFEYLSHFDYVLLSINFLILVFSKWIIESFSSTDNNRPAKLYALRLINGILFGLYIIAMFVPDLGKQISQTGVTLLVMFLASHFAHVFIIKKFGRDREIDGTNFHVATYQSEIFSLLISIIASITAVVIVINIWGLKDWLEATSVLGFLAILIFSTKDVWVPDNISGLMLLYANDIEPGALIKIEEHDVLAIVTQISLTRTLMRDLRAKHMVVLPNTVLRKSKIEVLNKSPMSGLTDYVEFNIAYGTPADKVETMLKQVWQEACEQTTAINIEKEPDILVVNTGDHAVTWRLTFKLKNYYQILDVEFLIKKVAYAVSQKHQIGLDTPLTHQVAMQDKA
jgi:small-conductance mechanosensitive channel